MHCDWRDDPLDPAFYDVSGLTSSPAPRPVHNARFVIGETWTTTATGFDEGEPLRRWTAYGPDGQLAGQHVGETWTPPDDAVRIEVTVGGQVTLVQSF